MQAALGNKSSQQNDKRAKTPFLVQGAGVFVVASFVLVDFLCYNGGMKAKKLVVAGLALAGLGVAGFATKKVVEKQHEAKKQEEMVAEVRRMFADMGTIATLYVELYESSLERLVGGVVFEDGRHYTFVYEEGLLHYEEETL